MQHPLHVIILAAGEGKRMKSSRPKVLQRIAGRSMLAHVIDSAGTLAPAGIHVVYGHGGDQVRAAFAGAGRSAVGRAGATAGHRPCRAAGHAAGAGRMRRYWCCMAMYR